jgi:hypothetical protein
LVPLFPKIAIPKKNGKIKIKVVTNFRKLSSFSKHHPYPITKVGYDIP